MTLKRRIEDLEQTAGANAPDPPETPEQTRVRQECEQSLALLRERAGGGEDLALRVAQDQQARALAKTCRERMRAFLATTPRR